jgi:hypothetical protein
LVLVCLDDLADHTEYATDNVAHSHFSRLGRHESSTDITNARDESLCVTCTFASDDAK